MAQIVTDCFGIKESFCHFRAIGDTQAIARSKEHIEQREREEGYKLIMWNALWSL